MIAVDPHAPTRPSSKQLHAGFLALLPRVERLARYYFRQIACPGRRADATAEAVAIAWARYRRCAEQGRDAAQFVLSLALLAARAAGSGRRLCGQERAQDALSPRARWRHGFAVVSLSDQAPVSGDPLAEALRDNTATPPDEQAAFRIDFAAWLRRIGKRRQRVARRLMLGERAHEVARRVGVSPGRVSQLRRELERDWEAFYGPPD